MEPVVTFHHFTTPRWVAARGGWADPATADRFARFCERAARHLGDLVARACTINEPNIVAANGYLTGRFPPGEHDPEARHRVNEVFADAHAKAVAAIRAGPGGAPVGITLAMSDWQAVPGGEAQRDALRAADEDLFLEAARGDDYLGVQTYTRRRVGPDGVLDPEPGVPLTTMGYERWPQALGATIRRAAEVAAVPILVTENGIATDDDAERVEFVRHALDGVLDCLADGVDVRGYFYWSALDNFEWAYGYEPRFGLVAVDRQTQARTPKPSAAFLGEVARRNALPATRPG
jgi:beta-glucosidase